MILASSIIDWLEWLHDLRTQKLRTISTVMGIAWGTFAVVALLAFGRGLEDLMREQAEGLGKGIVVVWPRQTTQPFAGYPEGRQLLITAEEVLDLEQRIPELAAVSPEYIRQDQVQRGERIFRTSISGVYPQFEGLRSMRVEPGGRFINARDVSDERRVMFLGDRIKEQLFGDEDAVGRTVVLRAAPFTVIGVMHRKLQNSDYGGLDENRICIPATTYTRVFGDRWVDNFVYAARTRALLPAATRRVYEVLGERLKFDPRDQDALQVWDTTQYDVIREVSFLGMNVLITLACVFTLLVGGIGVGNLMFLLVRRRTHEIGIRMALGARPRWILQEVLFQSLALVVAGGAAGFLAAWGLSELIGMSPLTENVGHPRISPTIGFATVALLGIIGLLAGVFPARKAARLDPVRALAD